VLRFPLTAVGTGNLAAAGWCLLSGRRHLLVFYGPVLAVAIVASWAQARRDATRTGVQLPVRTWALAAVGLAVAAASVSRTARTLGWHGLEDVGPSLVWIVGYHLLGRWGRNRFLQASTAVLFAASIGLAAAWSGDRLVATILAVSGLLLLVAATPAAVAP
jgi:hypothetical protein